MPKRNYRRILDNDSDSDSNSDVQLIRNNKFLLGFTKRRTFSCPHCKKSVVHLPRHLRTVHLYSDKEARHSTLEFNLRSTRKSKKKQEI